MTIRRLMTDEQLALFLENYFQRLPYSGVCSEPQLCELGSWQALTSVLSSPGADLMVVKENQLRDGPLPRTADEAESLLIDGYTLFVRKAERHDAQLAELAHGFAQDFAAPVDIHFYCTPPAQYGFAWHYDAEEVFIIQTSGQKEYLLRKNTVNPWPIEETLPKNMQYEREIMPLFRVTLNEGDYLYIPSGYWHRASAVDRATSLSIGLMPRTAIDLLDELRRSSFDSLLWRQRLPVMGAIAGRSDDELWAILAPTFSQLADDVRATMTSAAFRARFLARLRRVED